jgi:hypothetical protein
MQTFELRQYTMQPGRRDDFAALFDREFLEPQEAVGSTIAGQFRDLGDSNRFVWIRGHADMDRRKKAMTAFYNGPHWLAHREAANDCIADSDNVLLLRPAWPGAGFAEDRPRGHDAKGLITADICYFDAPPHGSFSDAFHRLVPAFEEMGGTFLAALVTERAENNFPRHPIREGEHVFLWFALYDSPAAEQRLHLPLEMERQLARPVERLSLAPTPRSRLRG